MFDVRDMAAITSPDFPGERLIVCRNHALATERARKREDLLKSHRARAGPHPALARKREPLRGKAKIGLAVGAAIDRRKMAKHFDLEIADASFAFAGKTAQIAAEAALGGLYAVRASLPETALDDAATVKSYKSLSLLEHAIRSIKTVDLKVRPVYHWLAERVRAHVFLCMLGYCLEWHMRQRWRRCSTMTMTKRPSRRSGASLVAKAERSPAAVAKQTTGRTPRRPSCPQLPDADRRPRRHRPKHRHHRPRAGDALHPHNTADTHPEQGFRPPRRQLYQ